MFILIPSTLIVICLAGIALIVRRKMPYLRKLSPESHEVSENMLLDYFPEFIEWFGSIPWHQYQQASLRELEKGLRRMRLAFLKIDHAAARLIQKIRHVHLSSHIEQTTALQVEKQAEVMIPEQSTIVAEPAPEDLKAQEQQLIIEIAQDPKNSGLYEKLGDLYMKMESYGDAKESYEAALGFSPDNQILARKYSVLLKKEESVG